MVIEISWTDEAQESYDNNVRYLLDKWSEKEVENFVRQTQKIFDRLQLHPESYPPGIKSKVYRRARVNKYIVLLYRYYKTKNKIVLLAFWNVKQDPGKSKY